MVQKKYLIKKKKLPIIILKNKKRNFIINNNYLNKFKQTISLKNKIINHQLVNGNKRTCENTLLKSLKFFQKLSFKKYKYIIHLTLINITPIFLFIKKKKIKKNKEITIPFIAKKNIRISYSIKTIIKKILEKNFSKKNYKNLTHEILFNAEKKNEIFQKKIDIQKYALTQRKQFSHFRWF